MDQGTAAEASPTRTKIIRRPRLTRLLDDAGARVFVLLAPAGYGKTTLAREWFTDPARKGVWLRANPAASDIAALALGVANVASRVTGESTERLLQWLRSATDPGKDVAALAQMVLDLSRDWPPSTWLVLDDYHFLAGSEPAEQLIDALVQEGDIPMLVTTRIRPAWATVRRVLYGDVFEIGQNLLSMTPDEAAEVLGPENYARDMRGLVTLSGGWPAVIGLAALSDRLPDAADVMPESLHAFLAEEVFREIPTAARTRLAKLSIAPEITLPAARALLGRTASTTIVAAVRAGFLIKMEDVYELHPLLRQFLTGKLNDLDRTEVVTAAERLADWYLAHDRWDEAFLVGAERDLPGVLRKTLDLALDRLLSEGRLSTLRDWISACRDHGVSRDALDLAATEIAFREGRWSDAEARAVRIAKRLGNEGEASRLYRLAGQSAHLSDRPSEALGYLDLAKRTAGSSVERRDALWNRFLVLGELEEMDDARQTLDEFERYRGDDVEAAVRASQAHLHLAARTGAIDEAVDAQIGTLDLLSDVLDPVVVTGFLQTWVTALCLSGRYEDARQAAEREMDVARSTGLDFVLPHALGQLALALLGLRHFKRAMATARETGQLAEQGQDLHCEINSAVIRARIELAQSRVDRALDELEDRWVRRPNPGMRGDFLATRALALACAGDYEESARCAELSEFVSHHIDSRVTRGFARAICADQTDESTRRGAMADAVETSSTTGNVDGFVCAYRAHPPILKALSELEGVHAARLTKVVQEVDPALARRTGLGTPRLPTSQGLLSPREREVLELLRQGLSNREISRVLWITEGTAKVHVRHILEKLGVRTRTEAAMFPMG